MTEKEKLEHEIKVLEEALEIMEASPANDDSFSTMCVLTEKRGLLKKLKNPDIWKGCLGKWYDGDEFVRIAVYDNEHYINSFNFHAFPIEVILKHLSGYVKGAVRWFYTCANSIHFTDIDGVWIEDNNGNYFIIPAPYREDWEGIGGEL